MKNTPLPSIVKQSYDRALRVPQVGRAARDPLGVWEDFFEQLHAGLTSCQPCAIIGSEVSDMEKAQIQALRDAIAVELTALPDRDFFGHSNAGDKAFMRRLLPDLDRVLAERPAETDEVKGWLEGSDPYFLNDFLPDVGA